MNVHKDLGHLPVFKNAVVTIGTFDGVHTGHQRIIQQLKDEAEKIAGETQEARHRRATGGGSRLPPRRRRARNRDHAQGGGRY